MAGLAACCDPHGAGAADRGGNAAVKCDKADLLNGGFTGAVYSGETIELMGITTYNSGNLHVYYYDFVNASSKHGTHRLLVFNRLCRYLGSYTLDVRPQRMEGNALIFPETGTAGNRVEFTGAVPPKSILIDGTYSELGR